MTQHNINTALWWIRNVLALVAATLFFVGLGQAGSVAFAASVLCGMIRAKK